MKSNFLLVFGVIVLMGQACNFSSNKAEYVKFYTKDAKNVISSDVKIENLWSGFAWAEGPVWIPREKMLLFSDIPHNMIYKWTYEAGVVPYLRRSGFTGKETDSPEPGSNGLLRSQFGDLILCQHGDRRVSRMIARLNDPSPSFETLANNYQGKRLNSPNDITEHSNGDLFFTDPPYGLNGQDKNPEKELDFCGVYRIDAPNQIVLLTDKMTRPNGIDLSPDEKTLYVANSDPAKAIWMAYDLDARGNIMAERVLYDATDLVGKEPGLPDGLKVHPSGLIFATGPGGVFIFTPEGEVSAKINLPQATANCAFDDTFQNLFITSDSILYRMSLIQP
jgi:gluconolactonase